MNILLATDGSREAGTMLDEIAQRPWPSDTAFEVLGIMEGSHLWTTSDVALEFARRAEEFVENATAILRAKGWKAQGHAHTGDAKKAVLDCAREIGANFAYAGAHPASVARWLSGDLASTVLRHAPCSAGVIRAKIATDGHTGMKILLATDGSPFSEKAARSIAARPWPAGSEVRVLSAVEMILPATRALLEPPFINDEFLESARAEAMRRSENAIASARAILTDAGLPSSESISVLLEPPKTVIIDDAANWGADLIVVGSHGHSGIDRLLLGSVSEAVAMHAACSVEVIR
jgi:nucleotide-binding universal stress UspA family protein